MAGQNPSEPEEPPIRFTDKRKIHRGEGAAETPPPAAGEPEVPAAEPGAPEPLDANAQLLEERTADLQRLQAEYANYRRRAERDRLAAGELATGRVLAELLPVLDDLERARAHGDLESGPLKAVADKLDTALTKLGLERFGEPGDEFDPSIHEAVLHDESDEVSVATATTVMRPGYRHNERLLRPAMVGVSAPAHPAEPAQSPAETPAEAPAEAATGENDSSNDDQE